MSLPINDSDDLRIGAAGATSAWMNGVQVWPRNVGSFCIDIDGPVTIPDDGVLYVMPLDGSTVVASPVDARFTFDGTDAISVPGPVSGPSDLFAILDIRLDLTWTGGTTGPGECVAYVQFLDETMTVYNEILLGDHATDDPARHTNAYGLTSIYIDPAGFIRFRVRNGTGTLAGPIDVSGTFCFDWRIGE